MMDAYDELADLDEVVADGRAFRDVSLTDTCRITRPGDPKDRVWDEASMKYTMPARVTVYEGPCRFQIKSDMNANVIEATSGDREWTYQTATLILRVDGTGHIRPETLAECLTSRYDPSLVGRVFNIEGVFRKSQATSRRFRIKEATA